MNILDHIEKSDREEAYSDTLEDQDPVVQIEVIAYTVYEEIDRAKGAA
jgi:hypothetical protein